MLTKDIASFLDGQGLGTYSETEPCTIFDRLPEAPDECIAIILRAGRGSPGYSNLEDGAFQLLVRSESENSALAEWTAQECYNQLHGMRHTTLVAGGDYILRIMCPQGGPINLGPDENGRMIYSLNFNIRWRNSARKV